MMMIMIIIIITSSRVASFTASMSRPGEQIVTEGNFSSLTGLAVS